MQIFPIDITKTAIFMSMREKLELHLKPAKVLRFFHRNCRNERQHALKRKVKLESLYAPKACLAHKKLNW